jgi:hypothetical protein
LHCAVNARPGPAASRDRTSGRPGSGVTLNAAIRCGWTVDAAAIKDIPVWGAVHEGRVLRVARS